MACTAVTIPTSPVGTAAKDTFKEHIGLRQSESGKDLCKRAGMQRSYSDNNICYSVNRIRAASKSPKLKSSPSVGFFPFQCHLSSSVIPNSVRSFLFDPETSKTMSTVDKKMNVVEDLTETNEEEMKIKKANWVERLMQIREEWVMRQQQQSVDGEEVGDEDEKGVCDSHACEGGCEVDYGSENEGDEIRYDRESFSRLLAKVPLTDTKLFSQLAFLSNMAYVIPEIKVCIFCFFPFFFCAKIFSYFSSQIRAYGPKMQALFNGIYR